MTWDVGAAGDAVLASGSRTELVRVDIWRGRRPTGVSLDVTGGSVIAEADRAVFASIAATLADATGALSGGDINSLLNPYDCEIAPWRGVSTASGDVWAPLGVFGLTGRNVNADGSVEIAGQDRAMGYQGPLAGALAIPGGTPIEDAIFRLLVQRNRGVVFAASWVTGFTCGPLLYAPDIDCWAEAQKLAASVGGWLRHDRRGGLVFSSALPTTRTPAYRWAEGEATGLVDVKTAEDSDTIHNIVVVTSTKTTTGGVITATAEDDDPTSPTYVGGSYGRRPMSLTSQHIGSVAQAQQMAATELVKELGRTSTATLSVVCDVRRDPLDVAVVNRPRSGLTNRVGVIRHIEYPLTVDTAMTVEMAKNILTPDGQVSSVPVVLGGAS